jgi:hypothetical protein
MGFGCDGTQQSMSQAMSIHVNQCQSMSINGNQAIHIQSTWPVMGFGRGSEQHGQKML